MCERRTKQHRKREIKKNKNGYAKCQIWEKEKKWDRQEEKELGYFYYLIHMKDSEKRRMNTKTDEGTKRKDGLKKDGERDKKILKKDTKIKRERERERKWRLTGEKENKVQVKEWEKRMRRKDKDWNRKIMERERDIERKKRDYLHMYLYRRVEKKCVWVCVCV